jgi:hypothetical protein
MQSIGFIALWFVLLAGIFAAPEVVTLENRGDFLIRNTARIALLYWVIAVVIMLRAGPARRFWVLACAAFLIHVAVSFEFAHHWSHAAAFDHVKQASGHGEGVFVSYLFTLVWFADALWWCAWPSSYEKRPAWIDWSIHAFMVFIIINGTVIFESGAIRWVSAAMLPALGLLWLQRHGSMRIASLSAREAGNDGTSR